MDRWALVEMIPPRYALVRRPKDKRSKLPTALRCTDWKASACKSGLNVTLVLRPVCFVEAVCKRRGYRVGNALFCVATKPVLKQDGVVVRVHEGSVGSPIRC